MGKVDAEVKRLEQELSELEGRRSAAQAELDALGDGRERDVGRRVSLDALVKRKSRVTDLTSTVAACDELMTSTRADLDAARREVNAARVEVLHAQEREQFAKVIGAADALWRDLEGCRPIWDELIRVGGRPTCGVPAALYNLLKPGAGGGRKMWDGSFMRGR